MLFIFCHCALDSNPTQAKPDAWKRLSPYPKEVSAIESIVNIEHQLGRLILGEVHSMMKSSSNHGSGSCIIPISQVQVEILERWCGTNFVRNFPTTKRQKVVYLPRSNLNFERVSLRCYLVIYVISNILFIVDRYIAPQRNGSLSWTPTSSWNFFSGLSLLLGLT